MASPIFTATSGARWSARSHGGGKQRDHRGAEQEGAHFVAALEGHGLGRLQATLLIGRARAVWPRGVDAGDDQCAHHHQRELPERGLQAHHETFVLHEEARDVAGGEGVDGEEAARHGQRADEAPVARGVDAVVVVRREVDGGERAAFERLGPFGIAEQITRLGRRGPWLAAECRREWRRRGSPRHPQGRRWPQDRMEEGGRRAAGAA